MTIKHFIFLLSILTISDSCLVAQTSNDEQFCSYPITITKKENNTVTLLFIPQDSVRTGSYVEYFNRSHSIIQTIYSFSCDSIFYYRQYNNGNIGTLGSYVLSNRLVYNDSIMMQRNSPPYDIYDTVLTHYIPVKIGTWYYFDFLGQLTKQEYFPFEPVMIKPKKKRLRK